VHVQMAITNYMENVTNATIHAKHAAEDLILIA